MKAITKWLLMAAAVIAGSCAKQAVSGNTPGNEGSETVMEIRARVANIATKAVDGAPTRYVVEAYTLEEYAAASTPLVREVNSDGRFTLRLKRDVPHRLLFWADYGETESNEGDYNVESLKSVRMGTATKPAFANRLDFTPEGKESLSVDLTHAVAKVNFVSRQALPAGEKTLKVSVQNPYSGYEVGSETQEAGTTPLERTFTVEEAVQAGCLFGSLYLFAPAAGDLMTFKFQYADEDEFELSNIPVKQNYQTDLKGSFSQYEDISIECNVIDEEFKSPSVWDGVTVSRPADFVKGTPGTVHLTTPGEFVWLLRNADEEEKFTGYTFVLDNDIDLDMHLLTPGEEFSGTLDGNGHWVSGLYMEEYLYYSKDDFGQYDSYISPYNTYVGLFGKVAAGTVKNLSLSSVFRLSGIHTAVGGIAGFIQDEAKIVNCTSYCDINIRLQSVDGLPNSVGGLIGFGSEAPEAPLEIRDNVTYGRIEITVDDVTEYSIALGGIAGSLFDMVQSSVNGNTSNVNINVENCVEQVNKERVDIGGIIGICMDAASADIYHFVNNVNNGDLTLRNVSNGSVGGIFGYIYTQGAYSGMSNCSHQGVISVIPSGKVNQGSIVGWVDNGSFELTGNTGAGDLEQVGSWKNAISVIVDGVELVHAVDLGE